jgi:endonuclease-8
VDDPGALVDTARRLLEANKAHASQATTGDPRRGHEHWVYGRAGRPCRRCGTTIVSAMQGAAPYDRITAFCPTCQPGPHPTTLLPVPRSARHRLG